MKLQVRTVHKLKNVMFLYLKVDLEARQEANIHRPHVRKIMLFCFSGYRTGHTHDTTMCSLLLIQGWLDPFYSNIGPFLWKSPHLMH